MKNIKKIKGDASHREFFRKKNKYQTSIIVLAKKEKIKNLLIYDAINKILNKNGVLAPLLYQENFKKSYIEIQDFGNKSIFDILNKKKNNKFSYFKKIINLLIQIQSIKDKRIKNFKNDNYAIPKYDKKTLIKEANLFCGWYLKKNLNKTKKNKFLKEYKKIIKKLASNLKQKNNVFVHRDFHVSNLMLTNNQIGVIDSQDALIGNRAYDLASLVDDVRLRTSESLKKKVFNFYLKKQKKIDINKFKNDFEILSILRNLKIIGIFSRLAIRDGKKNYLQLIPYAWTLINLRINKNKIFKDLKKLLKQNFLGKIK
jgi:aminoglycoside/choline kinase family phosphotransferase